MPAVSWKVQRPSAFERQARGRRSVLEQVILRLQTRQSLEFVDITDRVADAVHRAGLIDGVITIQTKHTTAGVLINEHEPLLLQDLAALFRRLVPAERPYAHDDLSRRGDVPAAERRNGHAHCRAALLRASESVPVAGGALQLGRWQRIFFVEFDGGQRRAVGLTLLGVASADPRET